MHRIDVPSAVSVRPTPTALGPEGWFRNANVGAGVQGTVVDADILNAMMAELVAIRGVGVPDGVADPGPTKTTTPQLATVLQSWMTARINALFPMAYPPGWIQGFRRSVPDLSTDDSLVDFHPGRCRANGGLANIDRLSGVMTKDISVDWDAGDNQGGWPSSVAAPSTFDWVFAFVIAKPDGTIDFGWDTDGAATNLLADATGYTIARIIGIDEPLPGEVVRSFYQYPNRLDYFEWARPKSIAQDLDVATLASGSSLSSGAPPGTTARIAVSHDYPMSSTPAVYGSLARYYPADDPTYDETIDASTWTFKDNHRVMPDVADGSDTSGPSFIFDVWGGGAASFRAKYAFTPVGMRAHFNSLGFFWDRLREVV